MPEVEIPLKGRLADIAKPLLQLTHQVAPDRVEAILATLDDMRSQREQQYAETSDGRVLSAVVSLVSEAENGLLPVARIREVVNPGFNASFLNSQKVGQILRSLGLKTRKYGKENRAHLILDRDQIRSLAATLLGGELP